MSLCFLGQEILCDSLRPTRNQRHMQRCGSSRVFIITRPVIFNRQIIQGMLQKVVRGPRHLKKHDK